MMALALYLILLMFMFNPVISDDTCWNDYQLGLDDGPAKGKEASRITSNSFPCSLDMVEVLNRLPKGDSCYEVGVRNAALWQLQSLAVVNQCHADDMFFSDHWETEPVPDNNTLGQINRLTTDLLNVSPSKTKKLVSQGLSSLKNSFASKFSRKPSHNDSAPNHDSSRPNSFMLERPQEPLSNTGPVIGQNHPSISDTHDQSNSIQMASNERHPMTPHLEPGQVPISNMQQDNIAEQSRSGRSPIMSSFSSDVPVASPFLSQQSDPRHPNTISTREITQQQQQQQRFISSGTASLDQPMSNEHIPSNSLLIPTRTPSRDLSSRNAPSTDHSDNDLPDFKLTPSRQPDPTQQQVSITTFKSESKTII